MDIHNFTLQQIIIWGVLVIQTFLSKMLKLNIKITAM